MAYFRERKQQEYQPAFSRPDEDGEMQEEQDPRSGFSAVEQDYDPEAEEQIQDAEYAQDPESDYDPEEEEPEEDEEQKKARRRTGWRITAGVMNFIAIGVGVVVILILIALLISLVTWLQSDMDQSFVMMLKNF